MGVFADTVEGVGGYRFRPRTRKGLAVEHRRCTHCRNPIRHATPIFVHADPEPSWFHPDCWAVVLAAKQKEYDEQIEVLGLDGLLAPYLKPAKEPAALMSSDPVPSL
jgi:hypothetical protein